MPLDLKALEFEILAEKEKLLRENKRLEDENKAIVEILRCIEKTNKGFSIDLEKAYYAIRSLRLEIVSGHKVDIVENGTAHKALKNMYNDLATKHFNYLAKFIDMNVCQYGDVLCVNFQYEEDLGKLSQFISSLRERRVEVTISLHNQYDDSPRLAVSLVTFK